MRQVRRVGLRVPRGRGALEDMDDLDALPANDDSTKTAEQTAWITAHRVYSVAFRLDDLTGLTRPKRAAAVYATLADCRVTAEEILEAHRAGLERLARRLYAEGDLAGAALRDALADALSADTLLAAS